MLKKELELLVQRIPPIHKPKLYLEQYTTPANIVADMVWEAFMRGDIEDRVVADLGCGSGRIAYASLMLGASYVLCIDIDLDVVDLAHRNHAKLLGLNDFAKIDYIVLNVLSNGIRRVDVVLQNPPFGIRSSVRDLEFLDQAFKIASTIYSLHRSNNESRILIAKIARDKGFDYALIKTYDFPIPQLHERHRRRIYYIKVDLWRFARRK